MKFLALYIQTIIPASANNQNANLASWRKIEIKEETILLYKIVKMWKIAFLKATVYNQNIFFQTKIKTPIHFLKDRIDILVWRITHRMYYNERIYLKKSKKPIISCLFEAPGDFLKIIL